MSPSLGETIAAAAEITAEQPSVTRLCNVAASVMSAATTSSSAPGPFALASYNEDETDVSADASSVWVHTSWGYTRFPSGIRSLLFGYKLQRVQNGSPSTCFPSDM